jgi:hypothetical protein
VGVLEAVNVGLAVIVVGEGETDGLTVIIVGLSTAD